MSLVQELEPRWIALDGAVNARDVGGLPLDGGGAVAAGRLLRSDNLQDLSPRDVDVLLDAHGVRTVVDLRTGVEVVLEGPGPLVHDPRVTVEHRSLYPETGDRTDIEADAITPWQAGVTGAAGRGESATVQSYLGYLEHRPDSIVAALRTIAAPAAGGAVLVHCAAGKDRTGMVVALALEAAGVPRAAIVEDYVASAQRIEAIVGRLVASPTYAPDMHVREPRRHAPRPATIWRVFELLDAEAGGPAAWMAAHGFDAGAQAALRARLSA